MTNEFAIKVLTELKGYGDKFANIGFDRKEALDMAIKALEQQPKSITIDELEDRLDALHEKIIDSCMEYYINGNRLFLVDADDCAEMVYEVLEGLK